MQRKNFKELKAIVKHQKQRVSNLKKALRREKVNNIEIRKALVASHNAEIDVCDNEITRLNEQNNVLRETLLKANRKKWYQFERI